MRFFWNTLYVQSNWNWLGLTWTSLGNTSGSREEDSVWITQCFWFTDSLFHVSWYTNVYKIVFPVTRSASPLVYYSSSGPDMYWLLCRLVASSSAVLTPPRWGRHMWEFRSRRSKMWTLVIRLIVLWSQSSDIIIMEVRCSDSFPLRISFIIQS